jgi:BirA family transcriptional regulator, biotin operon repressor / biotin---[acetyl-CoA-carboxylase] ligase
MATPYSVVRLGVTGSTQDDARRHLTDEPVLVIADAQTAGRGRGGSTWETAPRAVAMSLALRPDWHVSDWPLLPLLAAVAAAEVVDCELKWPNDLLVGGDKVGGILVEAGEGPLVIGMGLNLWWPNPPAGYGSLSNDEPLDGESEVIATSWADRLLGLVAAGPRAWPHHEYTTRCVTIGADITWDPEGEGRAVGIAPDGALIVETPAGMKTIRSGEVRHLRTGAASHET